MENVSPSQLIELARLDQLPFGQGRCVSVAGRQIAVFRLRDGRVFAIASHCPHRAGPLSEGIVGVDTLSGSAAVICPFHSYKFALENGCGLDSDLSVQTYPVTLHDGRVFLALE